MRTMLHLEYPVDGVMTEKTVDVTEHVANGWPHNEELVAYIWAKELDDTLMCWYEFTDTKNGAVHKYGRVRMDWV